MGFSNPKKVQKSKELSKNRIKKKTQKPKKLNPTRHLPCPRYSIPNPVIHSLFNMRREL